MTRKPFRMGAWNPAGARTLAFATRRERDEAMRLLSRTGYTTWRLQDDRDAD